MGTLPLVYILNPVLLISRSLFLHVYVSSVCMFVRMCVCMYVGSCHLSSPLSNLLRRKVNNPIAGLESA